MKTFFRKNRLLAFAIAPLLAASPILADDVKEPVKKEIVQEVKESEKLDEVSSLIAKRLDLAKKLATHKWNNQLPIDEPQKEEAFLNEIEKKAEEKGLDPKIARAFFTSQIEAAKAIGIQNFEKWVAEDIHKHKEVVNFDETSKEMQQCDELLIEAMSKKAQDLNDKKRREAFRVMISKALKDSKFSRECIDSATNF